MTKKTFITAAEMRRLAAIAKELGIRVEVEAGGIDYSPPEL